MFCTSVWSLLTRSSCFGDRFDTPATSSIPFAIINAAPRTVAQPSPTMKVYSIHFDRDLEVVTFSSV